jgi:predicted ribosome quality control (RQC) complex YloA/Tae2 family protein
MAFDGYTVAAVVYEMKERLLGARIEKIYQPGRDEIVLRTRKPGAVSRLLLTANASAPRAHFIAAERDNPDKPPMFCMVARKRLSGGRITAVTQPGFDRNIHITVESADEMGDITPKTIAVEMMGRHSNIILVDSRGFIIDSVHRVPINVSSVREILPGGRFIPPPPRGKEDPREAPDLGWPPFAPRFNGVSARLDEEIARRAMSAGLPAADVFRNMLEKAARGEFEFFVETREGGRTGDSACYYIEGGRRFESVSEMLEFYYRERDAETRLSQRAADLQKLLSANIDKRIRKRALLRQTVSDAENRDALRLYGEIITANIYSIAKGEHLIEREDYNSPGETLKIPLDPRKTPSENAQFYFRQYSKKKRAEDAAKEQARKNEEELGYLESVLAALPACETEADINEVREELAGEGYVKRRGGKAAKTQKPSKPLSFEGENGARIFVGKNNRQNDELTFKTALPDDVWLHAKDIPGSHVIIKLNGAEFTESLAVKAAAAAAYYSKARGGSGVPVDYTRRRFVKKPSGAKPGFVVYTNQKTVLAAPEAPERPGEGKPAGEPRGERPD